MILIVGLGNPGEGYEKTPHNMGFRVMDVFKDTYFSDIPWESKHSSLIVEGELHNKSIFIQKPLTFMNHSGIAVENAVRLHKVRVSRNLWVVHDDLDISWGKVRVDFARHSAGHKGVQSIINELETNEFWRLRIGVRPDVFSQDKADIDRYLTEAAPLGTYEFWDETIQQEVTKILHDLVRTGIKDKFTFNLSAS